MYGLQIWVKLNDFTGQKLRNVTTICWRKDGVTFYSDYFDEWQAYTVDEIVTFEVWPERGYAEDFVGGSPLHALSTGPHPPSGRYLFGHYAEREEWY